LGASASAPGNQSAIEIEIGTGAALPTQFAAHAVTLDLAPDFRLAVTDHGPIHALKQRIRTDCGHDEAGRATGFDVVGRTVDDGVGETASAADHGRCAVTQTIHLVEAAGFEA